MNSPANNGLVQPTRSCDASSQNGGRDALVACSALTFYWRRGFASTLCDEGVAATKGNS